MAIRGARITLQQLAKLVAIELRWPSLLQDEKTDTTVAARGASLDT
jgi:hypothetical protein